MSVDRDELLDRLAALGGSALRARFADAPVERIEPAIADIEAARRDIARYGRLGAEWRNSGFVIERKDDTE